MKKLTGNKNWTGESANIISSQKRKLAHLSVKVRTDQFDFFLKKLEPKKTSQILDLGVTPDEELVDSNLFEKLYPYKKQLVIASVENCKFLVKKYGVKKFIKVVPGKPYPFKKNEFDIVVSWATLEHVGGKKEQKYFLKELDRIAKKTFITTPYKYCPYEPHTELWLLHWLPNKFLRKILLLLNKKFWAQEKNWRALGINDIKEILPNKKYKIYVYKMFNFLPSHILIYKC